MIGHDELRKLLRTADPAKGRELTPLERARMKAAIADAGPRRSRSLVPILAMGAVMATILVAAILVLSRPGPPKSIVVTKPTPSPTAPTQVAQIEPPRPVPVTRPRRTQPAQARPAVLDLTPHTTRIEFTAPEGTRILWFVGSSDEKELGS